MVSINQIRSLEAIAEMVENVLESHDLFIFVPICTLNKENNVAASLPAVADQFMKPGESRRN